MTKKGVALLRKPPKIAMVIVEIPRKLDNQRPPPEFRMKSWQEKDSINHQLAVTSHLSMISLFFRFETQVSWWNHSDSPRIYTWANINCRTSAMCRMIFHVYIGCYRFSRSQFGPWITTLYNNSASRPGSTPQAQRFPLPWHTFLARRVQRALHAGIDGVIFTRFFGAWRDSLVLGGVGIMTTVNFINWGYNHLINSGYDIST